MSLLANALPAGLHAMTAKPRPPLASTLDALVRRRLAAYLDSMTARPTQDAIGAQISRTQTWVSHYLAGRTDADLDTLNKICDFIGIRLSTVIEDALKGKTAAPRPPAAVEVQTLFAAITPDEQKIVINVLATLARRPAAKRSRDKRGRH